MRPVSIAASQDHSAREDRAETEQNSLKCQSLLNRYCSIHNSTNFETH